MRAVLMGGLKQSRWGSFKSCVNHRLTMSGTVARMHHCRLWGKWGAGRFGRGGPMKKWTPRSGSGALIGAALTAAALAGPIVSMPGPVDLEGADSRRQLWLVPSQDPAVPMQTTVFRPPGEGPFPLVLMNHGTTQDGVQRLYFPLLGFNDAALWFARRGFAVVAPQRPGHGDTGGPFLEDVVSCQDPDFQSAGLAVAEADLAALSYIATQPFIKDTGVLVVGQSAGGF